MDQLNCYTIYRPTYNIYKPRGKPQNPDELKSLVASGMTEFSSGGTTDRPEPARGGVIQKFLRELP